MRNMVKILQEEILNLESHLAKILIRVKRSLLNLIVTKMMITCVMILRELTNQLIPRT
jgi:hypothetical protein